MALMNAFENLATETKQDDIITAIENVAIDVTVDDTSDYQIVQGPLEETTYTYIGYQNKDGAWYIKRLHNTTYEWGYVKGASDFATNWTDRDTLTYGDIDTIDGIPSAIGVLTQDVHLTQETIGLMTKLNEIEANQLPNDHDVNVTNLPTDYAKENKQLPDNHQVVVSNIGSTPLVDVSLLAKESKQLPNNHQVTVSNIASTPLITGFATETKQDTQIQQITDVTHENIHTNNMELRVYQEDHTCIPNSSTTPLGANATFTGDWQDTHGFAEVMVSVNSNVGSATDGVVIEWSSDGITKHEDDVYTKLTNTGKTWSFPANRRYVRIKYTNGSVAQSSFNLETTLKVHASKGSSHRLKDSLVEDDDAIVTKSQIVGITTAGGGSLVNVKANPSGALTVESTIANTVTTIDYPHHEIHDGKSFYFNEVITLGNNASQDYIITVPVSGNAHFGYNVESTAGGVRTLMYETPDRNGTTLQTIRNRNRILNTANTVTVHKGQTGGTTDGTLILDWSVGTTNAGGRSSGNSAEATERILKPGKYLFRVTSKANSNDISVIFNWYENGN